MRVIDCGTSDIDSDRILSRWPMFLYVYMFPYKSLNIISTKSTKNFFTISFKVSLDLFPGLALWGKECVRLSGPQISRLICIGTDNNK